MVTFFSFANILYFYEISVAGRIGPIIAHQQPTTHGYVTTINSKSARLFRG
jgi:hypothetical protein